MDRGCDGLRTSLDTGHREPAESPFEEMSLTLWNKGGTDSITALGVRLYNLTLIELMELLLQSY